VDNVFQGDLVAPDSPLAVLSQAARALHGEPDLGRAVSWALDALAGLSDTDDVGVCLLARDASATWYVAPHSTSDFHVLGDPRTIPLLAPAVTGDGTVVIEDLASAHRALPGDVRLRRSVPVRRLLVVPIVGGEETPHGAVVIGWTEPGRVEPEVASVVAALSSHLGVALDNHARVAHLAEVEARGKEVVHSLQEALRPPAPAVPFAELGVHYVAADPSAPTGGDLYDWVLLPSGELHLSIVDVMGKGVEATKHALVVTHALRLLALDGCPLATMVERTDEIVTAQTADLVATLMVARYDPDTGRVQLAGGGHPPALVVSGESVREVAAPGIPIGWPGAGSTEVVELHLDRSETLILYTDGLIEATKDILQGLADLADAARHTAGYPATSMARALVERQLADAARHDDSLAVVLRRRTPPVAPTRALAPLVHQFSPSTAAVPVARHLLSEWLERVPVDAAATDGLLLVASELCSNAVKHASGSPRGIVLRAAVEENSVVLEVTDDGGGAAALPAPVPDELPDPDAERGRGLFLVRTLSDSVEVVTADDRTTVRTVKRWVIGDAGGDTSAPVSPGVASGR
jgi:serine phosphatase RsbU (regulator of sigma subunit)/anti-sigma regulatory factor (Ser/Thr protein kinase)